MITPKLVHYVRFWTILTALAHCSTVHCKLYHSKRLKVGSDSDCLPMDSTSEVKVNIELLIIDCK